MLTHRRNHRRLHLAICSFGCRKEHERKQSNQRTLAYYRKRPERKRALNQMRYRLCSRSDTASTERADVPRKADSWSCAQIPKQQEVVDFIGANVEPPQLLECPAELAAVLPKAQDPQVMGHVQVVVSLLEGRQVSFQEIWQALLHFWRQRTIGHRRKIDHTLAWLNANPP